MNTSTLVVGANAYLGQYICATLLKHGAIVDGTICRGPGLEQIEASTGHKFRSIMKYDAECDDPKRLLHDDTKTIVYVSAISDGSACEKDESKAARINVPSRLVEAASSLDLTFVYISTDLVFDGIHAPYRESDSPSPLSAYGRSKAVGEDAVRRYQPAGPSGGHVIIRPSLLIGPPSIIPSTKSSCVQWMLKGASNPPLKLFTDEYRTPTYVDDVAELILLIHQRRCAAFRNKVLHFGGPSVISRYDLGVMVFQAAGLDSSLIVPSKQSEITVGFARPPNCALDSTLGHSLVSPTPLVEAISKCISN